MMRLAAFALLLGLAALPLSVRPAPPPVLWLTWAAFAVGGIGVLVWSVPLVTAAGVLALIGYALALVIVGPAADPLLAAALGAALVLLLALVHFAGRVRGAALGPGVVAAQARRSLAVAGLGVAAAMGLLAAAVPVGALLRSATFPVVVAVAALGVLMTMAGVIALIAGAGRGDRGA
jgi:hypothetical protein